MILRIAWLRLNYCEPYLADAHAETCDAMRCESAGLNSYGRLYGRGLLRQNYTLPTVPYILYSTVYQLPFDAFEMLLRCGEYRNGEKSSTSTVSVYPSTGPLRKTVASSCRPPTLKRINVGFKHLTIS